ncbi:MAG TPA: type IV-A pilus assembly ATPase PilB, partial [Roseiflexaceae bacterium]|nr:type IV-A pilus assembly ATPase PilB [Roseiflexaceae bacterium]
AFNVASDVNLITAQRLVRRVCQNCKEPVTYPREYLDAAGLTDEDIEGITFYRGAGCDTCGGSGYKGRQGLYEVMAMSPTLRRMVLQGASTAELQAQAISEGMLTLRMDGFVKLRKGITTLEEVIKETAG